MKKCDWCEELVEEVENWGRMKLCKSCADNWRNTRPNKPIKKTADYELYPGDAGYAQYDIDTSNVKILDLTEERTHISLNHEHVHRAIHLVAGQQACWQYDNIGDEIDVYHS